MTSCRWETEDCKFHDSKKCDSCFSYQQFYQPEAQKSRKGLRHRQQKADKRMGSSFEKKNHDNNTIALRETESNMTINSGATRRQKGDENITGYVKVMEELKTQLATRAKGTKSFTIQREWLDKLSREASQRGFEFWYLVFQFSEHEDEPFVVVEKDMVFNMIQNMVSDRKRADLAAKAAEVSQKETEAVRAELGALYSKIAYLESKVELLEQESSKEG